MDHSRSVCYMGPTGAQEWNMGVWGGWWRVGTRTRAEIGGLSELESYPPYRVIQNNFTSQFKATLVLLPL